MVHMGHHEVRHDSRQLHVAEPQRLGLCSSHAATKELGSGRSHVEWLSAASAAVSAPQEGRRDTVTALARGSGHTARSKNATPTRGPNIPVSGVRFRPQAHTTELEHRPGGLRRPPGLCVFGVAATSAATAPAAFSRSNRSVRPVRSASTACRPRNPSQRCFIRPTP